MNARRLLSFLKKAGLNLLLCCVGVIFALALVEVGLHLLIPAPQEFHMRDPYVGKRFKPNATFVHDDKLKSNIHINSLGWNSPEFSVKKPDGVTRIVHLGDSLVEGIQVDTTKTFSSLIGTKLPKTESLDLGIAGNGTYPELLTYRHYAREYGADVTMVWFSDNDFRDNFLVQQVVNTDAGAAIPSDNLGWLKVFLLEHFRLPAFLYGQFFQNHIVVSALIKMGLLSMQPQEYGEPIPLLYRTTVLDTPERTQSVLITKHLFTTLNDEVKADHGTLVIGYIASYYETHPGSEEELRKLFPDIGAKKLDHGYPRDTMKKIADDLGVPFIDLTPVFSDAYAHGKAPHIPNDGHLNEEGHRLVADTVAKWLQEKKLCCGYFQR